MEEKRTVGPNYDKGLRKFERHRGGILGLAGFQISAAGKKQGGEDSRTSALTPAPRRPIAEQTPIYTGVQKRSDAFNRSSSSGALSTVLRQGLGHISRIKQSQYLDAMAVLSQLKPGTFEERAFGCILGAFAADACGSYWEFEERYLNATEMNVCMLMPGGGPHKVAPG